MKLIFRGRIISNKDISISEFKLEDGCVIHCMGQPSHKLEESSQGTSNMAPSGSINDTSTFSSRSIEHGITSTLSDAILKMKTNHNVAEFTTGLTTLSKILTNVVEKPLEEKFRRLKKTNSTFHNKFGRLDGAQDALLAVGFEINGEEYVLTPSAEAWPKVLQSKSIVDEAVMQNQRVAAQQPQTFQPTVPGVSNGMSFPGLRSGTGVIDPTILESMSGMFQNPAALQAMLSNPMLQQMMEHDPRIANNPMARESLRQLQNNPQLLEQVSRMMSDPQTMRQVTSMMQQSGGPIGYQGFSNTGASGRSNTSTGNSNGTNTNSNTRSTNTNTTGSGGEDSDMTEEEMIQEAIRRSMQDR